MDEGLASRTARALSGNLHSHADKLAGQGKLFVRDRLDLLLDSDSFVEDALLANAAADDLPADGVVTGIGSIDGRAVCVVLHDLALAAAYADRMALIAHGRLAAVGTPREVLTEDLVADAYGLPVRVVEVDGVPTVVPRR